MKLIVGLGNPGNVYKNTRHNIGFMVLDKIANKLNESFNKENLSFVPSLHQLINNKAFIKLIIPWICDISVITIYSSMLPFFLNAIINPQKYCRVNNIPLKDAQCSTNYYLGLSISIFFICCIISCNIWHYLVSKFGKVFCWRIYSLFTFIAYWL